jgi:hypothetical protein
MAIRKQHPTPALVRLRIRMNRVSIKQPDHVIPHLDFGNKAGQEILHPQDIFLLLGFDQVPAPRRSRSR